MYNSVEMLSGDMLPPIYPEFSEYEIVLQKILEEYDGVNFTEDQFANILNAAVREAVSQVNTKEITSTTLEGLPRIFEKSMSFVKYAYATYVKAYVPGEPATSRVLVKVCTIRV